MSEEKTETETDRKYGSEYLIVVAVLMFFLGMLAKTSFHQCKPEPEAPRYENHKMGAKNIIKFFYEGEVYYNTWSPRGLWCDSNGDMPENQPMLAVGQYELDIIFNEILRRERALRLVEAAGK